MKRPPIYSSSARSMESNGPTRTPRTAPSAAVGTVWSSRLQALGRRWSPRWRQGALPWSLAALLAALLMTTGWRTPSHPPLTQRAIDEAVLHALNTHTLPSAAARAYEAVIPSVVRVTALVRHPNSDELVEHGTGTGVVIVDRGVILTNLHVVATADTIRVDFFDGSDSTASLVGLQAENDLAVLQAHEVPDDLIPATMISTADLRPGDQVVAVGHPFGIGPSVSSGVVSGLQRSFTSPDGGVTMHNLIQFDAAANPGNSGGPLATMSGEVVGIVTAIYNPNRQRTFVGIGFAVPIENAAQAAGLPPF